MKNLDFSEEELLNCNRFLSISPKLTGGTNFFKFQIHFHPSHLQIKINDSCFCAQVGLFLTKLNNYHNVVINTNVFLIRVIRTVTMELDVSLHALVLLYQTDHMTYHFLLRTIVIVCRFMQINANVCKCLY